MSDFKVGYRVRYVGGLLSLKDDVGTILRIGPTDGSDPERLSVEWDRFEKGHDLVYGFHSEVLTHNPTHGWWVSKDDVIIDQLETFIRMGRESQAKAKAKGRAKAREGARRRAKRRRVRQAKAKA